MRRIARTRPRTPGCLLTAVLRGPLPHADSVPYVPDMRRAILLVDHGSPRAEANDVLEGIARAVQAQGGPELIVRHAHMELAAPSLAEAMASCVEAGAERIVVHPYFLTPGRHAVSDIPRMAREAAAHHPGVEVRVSEPLGVHPLLATVVLERCATVD